MTDRDRIRTQVGAVKRDTQAMLKRFRDERVEKARARRPLVQAQPSVSASRLDPQLHVVAAHDRFAAGPGVDRFFDGGEPEAPFTMPVQVEPPEAPAAAAPILGPLPPVRSRDTGALIGLEPVVVRGTQGRRQPEPQLTPVDKAGIAIPPGSPPARFDTGHRAATSTPRVSSPASRPDRTGVKTRKIDPSALGLEPVFGGSVELPLAASSVRPSDKRPESTPHQPASASTCPPERESLKASPTTRPLALATIAAIGPGLAWKLQNLGIMTLEDLVSADPGALRAGLGPLGALVRLDSWIDEAKQLLATRRSLSSET
jgi:predicted flap endonuclease-1-like 5' DNA nuclease